MAIVISFLLIIYCFLSVSLFNRIFRIGVNPVKYQTIEGLRGYLAYFVLLHHFSVWFFYLQSGTWEIPLSHFFTHLGESGVGLFFMISAFLFTLKALNDKPIDWKVFFLRRFLRLFPVYFFSVLCIIFIAFAVAGFKLQTSPLNLLSSILKWVGFTYLSGANINNLDNTAIVEAGVV